MYLSIYALFAKNFFGKYPKITTKTTTRYGGILEDFNNTLDISALINEIENSNRPYEEIANLLIDGLWYHYVDQLASGLCMSFSYNSYIYNIYIYIYTTLHLGANKFTSISNILQTFPQTTDIFKFMADPPATTRERIKSEVTGRMSIYNDVTNSFSSMKIPEDNIYSQLKSYGYKSIAVGTFIFKLLDYNYFYKTYNEEIDRMLVGELMDNEEDTKWDVLLAYFNGIDHTAHVTKSSCSESIISSLEDADKICATMIHSLKRTEDSARILFVYGDHGLTSVGGHFDTSEEALTSALFVHVRLLYIYIYIVIYSLIDHS